MAAVPVSIHGMLANRILPWKPGFSKTLIDNGESTQTMSGDQLPYKMHESVYYYVINEFFLRFSEINIHNAWRNEGAVSPLIR